VAQGVYVCQRLSFGAAGKAPSQTVAKVANRTREIRPSGMRSGARGNVVHGGPRNPTRNRKSGLGHSLPFGARASILSRRPLPLLGNSRLDGEPVIHLQSWCVCRRTHWPPSQSAEQASVPGGRPLARGTEATAEGGEGVGGLRTSFDVGELVGNSDPAEQRRPVLM
jgi:hypothetical protein